MEKNDSGDFNLSEKMFYTDSAHVPVYLQIDVAEFIRRLKELDMKVNDSINCPENMFLKEDVKKAFLRYQKEIDKLAGEKLI